MAKTDAERKQAQRDRQRAQGLQKYELWLNPKDWPLVKKLAERLTKRRERK